MFLFRIIFLSFQTLVALTTLSLWVEYNRKTVILRPDTAAIILNWSRLPNVVRIVSTLCVPELDETLKSIVVWNNSPQRISHADFTACSKLAIYNSIENLYFQARFLACRNASTSYCFIQDDDYLVLPEIIRALRSRIPDAKGKSIHLLPTHEALSSLLRTTIIPSKTIHTSFAWLGHGAMVLRSQASDFLDLLMHINASEGELKMADNYFTILGNRLPEIWFDQGIELEGGQPFTVGSEGEKRNRHHITRAGQLLDDIVSGTFGRVQYTDFGDPTPPALVFRAPCVGMPCLLETNISLLPSNLTSRIQSASRMLQLEKTNFKAMGEPFVNQFLGSSPAFAVDNKSNTTFVSPFAAQLGDYVKLDTLSSAHHPNDGLYMQWLVDPSTALTLSSCKFEASADDVNWNPLKSTLECSNTEDGGTDLRICSVLVSERSMRFYRAVITDEPNVKARWSIWEVSIKIATNWLDSQHN